MPSIIQNKAYETLPEEGRLHTFHITPRMVQYQGQGSHYPPRGTYVAEDEGCKAPVSTRWCTSFLDPCHPQCHSQPWRKNLTVIVRKPRASGTQVDRWCLQILANSKVIITWGKWALEVWAVGSTNVFETERLWCVCALIHKHWDGQLPEGVLRASPTIQALVEGLPT